jgi:starvation-inducible DNA-binding protein
LELKRKTAEAANDEPVSDLLTQRMQVHEKNAWMLRSMVAWSPAYGSNA